MKVQNDRIIETVECSQLRERAAFRQPLDFRNVGHLKRAHARLRRDDRHGPKRRDRLRGLSGGVIGIVGRYRCVFERRHIVFDPGRLSPRWSG
ncbi:MAG: hypothetical protein ACN6QU_16570 [Paraburkholderia terricola]